MNAENQTKKNRMNFSWLAGATKVTLLASCTLAITLVGCSTAKLTETGKDIEVAFQLDRKDCTNLGPVMGKGGGSFFGGWISDEKLVEFATNDIRNKAATKGANLLIMGPHQMGNTSGQYGGTTSTATISGVAYRCPRATL